MHHIINTAFALAIFGLVSCANNKSNTQSSTVTTNNSSDSAKLVDIVKNLYRWHAGDTGTIDYNVICNDSFATGVDSTHLMKRVKTLESTGFFDQAFLENYIHIGLLADSTLRSSKHYNEINFNFQEADPWNFFQDDVPQFWEHLIISNLKVNGENASLAWRVEGTSDSYNIRFAKTKDGWKIDYMQGFDPTQF
jgi:hypothetical protein